MMQDNIIGDKLLGDFERTGEYRIPKKGDYYQCERVPGVGLRGETRGGALRWILRPLTRQKKVQDASSEFQN